MLILRLSVAHICSVQRGGHQGSTSHTVFSSTTGNTGDCLSHQSSHDMTSTGWPWPLLAGCSTWMHAAHWRLAYGQSSHGAASSSPDHCDTHLPS